MELETPIAPTNPDRWAWERYYTATVEYLMAARPGQRMLKPSEVAETAKTRTESAYLKVSGESQAPVWLRSLGEPPTDPTKPVLPGA